MRPPVFILAPPRSFTSIVCASLGQHPDAYGLPETQLFVTETMAQWCQFSSQTTFPLTTGLLRAVAQLFLGKQTDETIMLARRWIWDRRYFSTGKVFGELVRRLDPLLVFEKSPSMVFRLEFLERTHRAFPQARYIHLLRHPRGFCESVVKSITSIQALAPAPDWLLNMAWFPTEPTKETWLRQKEIPLDPQGAWLSFHTNISAFLNTVSEDRKIQIRGEELLMDADRLLGEITRWLGLSQDSVALERMKHPELSPYARLGPAAAPFGNDPNFLENPTLRRGRVAQHSLEGALSWKPDEGFRDDVKRLALQFGYS